jgi:hypothetical protein
VKPYFHTIESLYAHLHSSAALVASHQEAAKYGLNQLEEITEQGYMPRGDALFGTAPLNSKAWLFIIALMPGMLLLEELHKAMPRRMS